MQISKLITLTFLAMLLIVIEIESCANSGRCRVRLSDGTTDLLFFPYLGQIVDKSPHLGN